MDTPSYQDHNAGQQVTQPIDVGSLANTLRAMLHAMHLKSSAEEIGFPSAQGGFPNTWLPPAPVVVDANILYKDILYACRRSQRTTLVTAANAQILRLFCAQHVVDEVFEHVEDWTDGSGVSSEAFLDRWMSEYLPVIRVVPPNGVTDALLSPEERSRVEELIRKDADDVPSVTLALVLEAFYLSKDGPALRAVYGADADLTGHDQWVTILKAGGDAGEFQAIVSIVAVLGASFMMPVKRLVEWLRWWSLIPFALGSAIALKYTRQDVKHNIKSAAVSIGKVLLAAAHVYSEVLERFQRAAPSVPDWEDLATTNDRDAMLLRACLHTLARSPRSDRSAEELAADLPVLGVGQGEAKVRAILRSHNCFFEVWRGRWQVGEVAELLRVHLEQRKDTNVSTASSAGNLTVNEIDVMQ